MAVKRKKIWFTAKGEYYVEPADRFFFTSDDIPEIRLLEQKGPEIIREYLSVSSAQKSYSPYFQPEFAYPPESWDTLPLYVFGVKRAHARFFPQLVRLLENTPHMVGCYFSKVSPKSHINPHCGVTDAIYRCHMGILLPSTDKAVTGMKVGNETRAWQVGRFFGFNDANYHSTWNKSGGERVVLIVDILREEFRDRKYFLFSRILVSYGLLKLEKWFPFRLMDRFLRTKASKFWMNIAAVLLIPVAWVYVQLSKMVNRKTIYPDRIS